MNERFWPIWSPVVFQLFLNIMLSKGFFFNLTEWQEKRTKNAIGISHCGTRVMVLSSRNKRSKAKCWESFAGFLLTNIDMNTILSSTIISASSCLVNPPKMSIVLVKRTDIFGIQTHSLSQHCSTNRTCLLNIKYSPFHWQIKISHSYEL